MNLLRFLLLFVLYLACLYDVYGQARKTVDSLTLAYHTAKTDTSQIMVLIEIASLYRNSHADTCITLASQALKESEKIRFEKGKAWAWNRIAFGYRTKAKYTEALDYIQKSLALFQQIKEEKGVAMGWSNLGYIYEKQGKYSQALEYYQKSLDVREKMGDKQGLASTLGNIASIYDSQSNYPQALEYYQKSLKIRDELSEKPDISTDLYNLGHVYRSQGKYPEALDYLQKSLKIREEIGDKQGISSSLNNIGIVYKEQDNLPLALEYYQKSLKIKEELKDKRGASSVLNNIAIIYKNQENYPLALEYHQRSLRIKEELKDQRGILYSMNNMGIIYKDQGNYPFALECYTKSLKISEEIGNKKEITYPLRGIAEVYQAQGGYDKSIEYALKSLEISKEIKALKEVRGSCKILYETYKLKTDYTNALLYHELYKQTNDTLFTTEKAEKIAKIEAVAEIERKQKAIEILHKNQELFKKDGELLRIEAERERNARLAIEKQADADKFLALSKNEKDKRKSDSLHAIAEKMQLEADNLIERAKKLQAESKTRQTEVLKEKEARQLQEYIMYLILIGLVFVILFAFYIFRNNKRLANTLHLVNRQKKEIEHKNNEIMDSILYAKHIQDAILPSDIYMQAVLPEHFVLFRPRSVVSGDFYYMQEVGSKIILAAVDCTGHGVPGALMSMIGHEILHEIVQHKKVLKADEILNLLHKEIRVALKQKTGKAQDGMDIALVIIDKEAKNLTYSGAKIPFYFFQDRSLTAIKADKFSIGGEQLETERIFTAHTVNYTSPITFYIFSDGFSDQFGGDNNQKFMIKQLRSLLVKIHTEEMPRQKEILQETLQAWMMNSQQTDDVLFIGVKL